MANQMSTNPWIVDTVGAAILWDGILHNVQVEYIDYASADDHVEVQDRNNRIVARLKGAADLRTVRTGKIGWVQGMKVPVLDSDGNPNMGTGKVLVYFE